LFFTCSDSESIAWTSYGVNSCSSSKIRAKTLPAFQSGPRSVPSLQGHLCRCFIYSLLWWWWKVSSYKHHGNEKLNHFRLLYRRAASIYPHEHSNRNAMLTPSLRLLGSRWGTKHTMVLVHYDFFRSWGTYVHLVDSSLQKKKCEEAYDPLFKIWPLVDHLSAMFGNIINQHVNYQWMQWWSVLGVEYHIYNTFQKTNQIWHKSLCELQTGLHTDISNLHWKTRVLNFGFQGRDRVVMDLRKRALGLYRQSLYESSSFHSPKYHQIEWDFVRNSYYNV